MIKSWLDVGATEAARKRLRSLLSRASNGGIQHTSSDGTMSSEYD
jgi:hypothetical protein